MKTPEHIIHYDEYSYEHNPELKNFLESTEFRRLAESIREETVIALGGDGTMLSAIRDHHEKELPFLGVNFGTKGFLLNDRSWISQDIDFSHRGYPLMGVENEGRNLGIFFNDLIIYSPEIKVIDLELQSGCGKLNLRGDGILIATPAGSTGHNKSCRGPILTHDSQNLILHPRGDSEQSLKTVSIHEDINIKNQGRKAGLGINLDGQQVLTTRNGGEVDLQISKLRNGIQLLIAEDHLKDWDNKVMQEQGFTA